MGKFAILAMITSHWMACAWGIVADLEDVEYNWMFYTPFNSYLVSGELSMGMDPRGTVSPMEIYVAAFYWSSMTMTTIGYGDIVPSTWIERIFVSVAMLVGAFMYGYIIGAVGNVIAQANSRKNAFYTLMGELNSFLDEGKLSRTCEFACVSTSSTRWRAVTWTHIPRFFSRCLPHFERRSPCA